MEGKGVIMQIPLFWQIEKFPFAPSFVAAVVMGVPVFPAFVFFGGVPDDLGVRPYQEVAAPAFQFFPIRTVYYFIFFPMICNPHKMYPFCNLSMFSAIHCSIEMGITEVDFKCGERIWDRGNGCERMSRK